MITQIVNLMFGETSDANIDYINKYIEACDQLHKHGYEKRDIYSDISEFDPSSKDYFIQIARLVMNPENEYLLNTTLGITRLARLIADGVVDSTGAIDYCRDDLLQRLEPVYGNCEGCLDVLTLGRQWEDAVFFESYLSLYEEDRRNVLFSPNGYEWKRLSDSIFYVPEFKKAYIVSLGIVKGVEFSPCGGVIKVTVGKDSYMLSSADNDGGLWYDIMRGSFGEISKQLLLNT